MSSKHCIIDRGQYNAPNSYLVKILTSMHILSFMLAVTDVDMLRLGHSDVRGNSIASLLDHQVQCNGMTTMACAALREIGKVLTNIVEVFVSLRLRMKKSTSGNEIARKKVSFDAGSTMPVLKECIASIVAVPEVFIQQHWHSRLN
jgi:hypothetical protein